MRLLRKAIIFFNIIFSCFLFSQPIFPQQLSRKYLPGHYYTKQGEKVSGLLKFNYTSTPLKPKPYGTCSLSFKSDKNASKIKLTTEDIKSFVMGQDSFTVAKDFDFRHIFYFKITQDFVQVLSSGKISLYRYYALMGSGSNFGQSTVTYTFLKKGLDIVHVREKETKDILLKHIKDFPELHNIVIQMNKEGINLKKQVDLYNDHFLQKDGI